MNEAWLAHHGIKGQKWGVRRFQNLDGSLTKAGTERYAKAHKKYDKAVSSLDKNVFSSQANTTRYVKAHNIAARHMNNGGIEKFNREYDEKLRSKGIDPKKHDYGSDDDYIDQYEKLFEEKLEKEYYKLQKSDVQNSKGFKEIQRIMRKYGEESLNDRAKEIYERYKPEENTTNSKPDFEKPKGGKNIPNKQPSNTQSFNQKQPDFEKPKGGKNIPNKQPSNTQSFDQKRRDFMKTYKPTKGSPNSLLDIDDPDFRKEYGVSDSDYERWKKNVR